MIFNPTIFKQAGRGTVTVKLIYTSGGGGSNAGGAWYYIKDGELQQTEFVAGTIAGKAVTLEVDAGSLIVLYTRIYSVTVKSASNCTEITSWYGGSTATSRVYTYLIQATA